MSVAAINRALATVIDPELRLPLTELDMIGAVSLVEGLATVEVKLTVVGCPAADRIRGDVEQALAAVSTKFEVNMTVMTADERAEAILGALYDWAEAIVPEH